MNLPAIGTKLMTGVKKVAGPTILFGKKHAPELALGGGVINFILSIKETIKATNKTNELLEYKEAKLEQIETESTMNANYTAEMREMDERNLTRNTRVELVKIWVKPGLFMVFTLICFGGAWKIVNGRYVAASTAYEGLDAFTKRYRQNVIDEFGADVDWRMAHSLKADELAERRKALEAGKDGEDKCKARKNGVPRTQYSKDVNNAIFDIHSSERWKRFWLPSQAIDFVRQIERELQSKVDCEGSAVLNDAFDLLGMPRTAQGAIVGWIKRPSNMHDQPGTYVSLGFANDETPPDEIRRILGSMNNEDIYIWITPNCDGVIYNLIDTPFHMRG